MLLAADIGNTTVSLGLYRGARRTGSWMLGTSERMTAPQYAARIAGLLGRRARTVKRAAMASVVPGVGVLFYRILRRLCGRNPVIVDSRSPLGFTVAYSPPSAAGSDRLAGAAAAVDKLGAPVVVASFGTAVTLDVVTRRRVFLGGAIAPGPVLAAAALARGTAKIPRANLLLPVSAIGRSTQECLSSGLILGLAAMVDGLLERMFMELGERPPVVATGGAAPLVVPHSKHIRMLAPSLVLDGIRLVAERVPGGRGK